MDARRHDLRPADPLSDATRSARRRKRRGLTSRAWRGAATRLLLFGVLAALAYAAYRGTADNLARRGIATGFGFLWNEAGFAIGEIVPLPVLAGGGVTVFVGLLGAALAIGAARLALRAAPRPIAHAARVLGWLALACLAGASGVVLLGGLEFLSYRPEHSFAVALLTGFANTLKVSALGCVLTTIVGVAIGVASLSGNLLLRGIATFYVETLRNVPLLIQVFFWYFGVLRALPVVRNSIDIFGVAALNNRGVFLPRPEATVGTVPILLAIVASIALGLLVLHRARRVQLATGRRPRTGLAIAAVLGTTIAIAWAIAGAPVRFDIPVRRGFNFEGGLVITPEFAALLLGLIFYTASFVAEIVRAGIQGVSAGQSEAARSLGLRDGQSLRLVVFPQALKVVVPPLISQYLSLTKDSSLGIAIAYPELVSVSNTMINQTGQPIEILAITITVYMALNLLVSLVLNRFNERRRWHAA